MIKEENETFKKYMQKGIEETADMNDVTLNLELITIWDWNHFLKVNLVRLNFTLLATMTDRDSSGMGISWPQITKQHERKPSFLTTFH